MREEGLLLVMSGHHDARDLRMAGIPTAGTRFMRSGLGGSPSPRDQFASSWLSDIEGVETERPPRLVTPLNPLLLGDGALT